MIMINRLIALIRRYPLIPAMFSMGWNLAYAAFNGVLGLAYSSYWYITLCAFYTTLGFMRLSIITISKSKKRTETSVMRHIGYGLIAFSIVLVGITLLSIREQQNPFRHRIVMITIAAYTFFIAGWSIYNIIKAHRKKIRYDDYAEKYILCWRYRVGFIFLERGILGTFGDKTKPFVKIMEASSGFVAFVLMIGLGVGMVLHAKYVTLEIQHEQRFSIQAHDKPRVNAAKAGWIHRVLVYYLYF